MSLKRSCVTKTLTSHLLLGHGKEKKTFFNFFYGEYTGAVSGLDDRHAQLNRLQRQISHWKSLFQGINDVLIMSDCNLCYLRWTQEDYQLKYLASYVQDFMLEESCQQIVSKVTRFEFVQGEARNSIIDHCYTDFSEKVSSVNVENVGDSDHLSVILKSARSRPSQSGVDRRSPEQS